MHVHRSSVPTSWAARCCWRAVRRLPGERPVLARSAARSQAPRPADCARAGHRRRGARFLESLARGLRDDARAALSRGCTRPPTCSTSSRSPSSHAPPQHLQDARWMAETRAVAETLAFDFFLEAYRPQVRRKRWRCLSQGPRRVRLLTTSRPSTEAHSHHQSHRKHLCDHRASGPPRPRSCLSRMTALTMVFKPCASRPARSGVAWTAREPDRPTSFKASNSRMSEKS